MWPEKCQRNGTVLEHRNKGNNLFYQQPNLTPLFAELLLVESELLTLKDVTVAATRLARAAGDNSVQATSLELLLNGVLDLALLGEAGSLLLLNRLALLVLVDGDGLALSLLASAANGLAVVSLVPLTERSSIDLDDGGAGQGVGTDEFVVRRVVRDTNDTGLAGAAFGGPGEVTGVEAEGTVLGVTAAGADGVNALGANTGARTLATSFESALLPYWQRSERMFKRNIRASELYICYAL